jgi:hypothetical protein
MSAGGTISGTPTVSGTFTYTVTVKDSAGNTGTQSCSVTVNPPGSASCVSISAIQGAAITPVTMVGSGGAGGPYTFSATGLPAGLTMSAGGTISGTPTVNGSFSYTVTVKDVAGNLSTVNCSVTVLAPVSATCVTIKAIQGVPITPVTMSGAGGAGGPYTFSSTGLPAGLTMSAGGTISGTPTVSGTFPYTVTVTDSAGHTGTSNCSVTVLTPVSATCVTIAAIQGVAIAPVTMTASGGTGSGYTFSASGLPTGLTMSAGGTISGTPTVNGTFSYTVTVKDSAGDTGTFNCSVTVLPPVSATCVTITAIQGVAIASVTMTASGGTGSGYTFSATGLPSGLTMSAGGTISGTPTVNGTFSYTVTVKDSAGHTGTFNCSVTVAPPVSASCVTITAVQGVAITPVAMHGSGGTGTGYTFSATGLPSGITISASGTISGTPTVTGTFSYTVTVKDSAGNTGTVNCSVTVNGPPAATCATITAVKGTAITAVTLTGSGGLGGPYTFTAAGLPAGLSISTGGTISGTPTASGTFSYTVTIKDKSGNTGALTCSVTVAPAPTATCATITAVQGTAITPVTLTGSGGLGGPYTFTAAGLPNGLGISSGGTISGTPAESGTFSYTVTIKDKSGNAGTLNCSVTVAATPSANCASITATKGAAISAVTLTGSGGLGAPYTFTATGLPTGLTLSTTGAISGTPTVGGTFSYTITVKDKAGDLGSVKCSVTVNIPTPPPLTVNCPAGTATAGSSYNSSVTASGGVPPYKYSVGAGALPPGLTLNSSTGAITGTPSSAGTYGFTIAVTDSTGTVGYSSCSGSCSTGVKNSWNFGSYAGQLGNWQNYTVGGIGINAYGYDTSGKQWNLNSQTVSGDEWGLGIWGASNNEIDSNHFVQLDLGNAINAGLSNPQLVINSANCSGTYAIYGSNTPGSLGSLLSDNVPANNNGFNVPSFGKYRYVSIVSKSGCCVRLASFNCNGGSCQIVVAAAINLDCGSCGGGNATVGSQYSSTLSVSGGTGPFTFSIISGSLPPGLSLNTSTGVISGTPAGIGGSMQSFPFTSKVVDAKGNSDTQTCTIKVVAPQIDLQCGSCGSNNVATVNQSYSESLTVVNGTPKYTFSITSGSLPPGLTLNTSTGVIGGTPTQSGTYSFTSKVVDANGNSDTATCSITVNPSSNKAPTIQLQCGSCGSDSTPYVGQPYSETLSVSGGSWGDTYTFSITSGSLPPGLSLNGSTGVISGTPTTAGTYSFTTKVVDKNGSSATATCTVTVKTQPVELQQGNCGQYAQTGQGYSGTWQATGGQGQYHYSISNGSLPPGLSLNSQTGTISGTPTQSGTWVYTGKVTDSAGNSDTINCILNVNSWNSGW